MRADGRRADEIRPLTFDVDFISSATGSVLVTAGATRVICTAMVEESVPGWMRGQGVGWITAEYGMLPGSTSTRKGRDATRGRLDGRTVEIQRLIGRSLRAVVDRSGLGERTVWVDCDVIQADGGTRCAAITGGYVALHRALAASSRPASWPSCRCPTRSRRSRSASSTARRCSTCPTWKTSGPRPT